MVNFANKPFGSQEKGAELTAVWGSLMRCRLALVSFTIVMLSSYRKGVSVVLITSH